MGGGNLAYTIFIMNDYELIPDDVSEANVAEEANCRASKLGYCTREGKQMGRMKISAGWSRKYEENFKRLKNGNN